MESVRPARLQDSITALRQRPVGVTEKSFGRLAATWPVTACWLADNRPPLLGGDFLLPVLVLRESALAANIAAMASYCASAGVHLAPHGKTTMAPQLLGRQLAAGAWGVTAATVSQVQVFRAFGIARILIANEVVDPAAIAWLAAELAADPDFDCYCFADSVAGVDLLTAGLAPVLAGTDRQLGILVELGQPGGRAGCRSVADAAVVGAAVAASPALRLAGAAGYEGSIGHDDDPATLAAIAAFGRDLRRLGTLLPGLGADGDYLLSAGGSAYFDIVVSELTAPADDGSEPVVLLRSGAYVTHDHGFYQRLSPGGGNGRPGPALTPAFELWAPVLSRPEPGLAIIGAGRHDVAFDQDQPVPLRALVAGRADAALPVTGMHVSALDDQHGYLRLPSESGLGPGDLVCLGISHPCTTFDKSRVIPVVDDEYRVIDALHTFF
jgi:D-serine deaminase-like pyridoxal phosphate-dependent protein